MNRLLRGVVVAAACVAMAAMAAAAEKSDNTAKENDQTEAKPCCKALCRATINKLDQASRGIDKAAAEQTKKAADADLQLAARSIEKLSEELEAKTKPPRRTDKDDPRPHGPQTPPCCQKICKRCVSALSQIHRAIAAAAKTESLDDAKPQIDKAAKALAALKTELSNIVQPPAEDQAKDKADPNQGKDESKNEAKPKAKDKAKDKGEAKDKDKSQQ